MDMYQQKYNELTEELQAQINNSFDTLESGKRLYNSDPNSLTHVYWAVSVMLARLKELYTADSIASLLEIGVDEKGVFVAFALNTPMDTAISETLQ